MGSLCSCTLNQLFTGDSYNEIKFSKTIKELVVILRSVWNVSFCTPHSVCFIISFLQGMKTLRFQWYQENPSWWIPPMSFTNQISPWKCLPRKSSLGNSHSIFPSRKILPGKSHLVNSNSMSFSNTKRKKDWQCCHMSSR